MQPRLTSGKVSVIIPAYNAGRFVVETLQSVLTQTHAAYEIILVNDGSTDDTAAVIGPYRDRITYLEQSNQGVCRARNAAVARATGDWILFLDADDTIHPNALEVLLSGGRSEDTNQVLYGDVIEMDARGSRLRARAVDFEGPCPQAARKIFAGGAIPPGAILVPAWLVRQVGLFDPRFVYAEDLDLWLRCAAYVPYAHVSHPVLNYRIHGASASRNLRNAMCHNIDVRLSFQSWCRQVGVQVLEREWTQEELIGRFLLEYFYRREWAAVDMLLAIARDRNVEGRTIARIRRYRRFPAWVFRLRDWRAER